MNPLNVVAIVAAIATLAVWIASLITHDHSWVDRIWSIIPVVYLWIFAGSLGLANVRLDLMAAIVTIWGARLTFNFARKGGYSGVEDYRWAVVRAGMKRWQFELFSLFFIAIYQNILLALITLPAYTVWQHADAPLSVGDILLAVAFFGFTVAETVADQQQWRFQARKHSEIKAGRAPEAQFIQTGLWRFSRHPNFFFEQAQWWTLFFFGVLAAGSILQWTVIGAVLLSVLFIGSTIITERISRSKYADYATYQASTSPIIPWPPRHAAVAVAADRTAG